MPGFLSSLFAEKPTPNVFWDLVAETRVEGDTTEQRVSRLETALSRRPSADIAAFHQGFTEAFASALRPEFWAAAHLVSSGGARFKVVSLIYWLLLRGREQFEATLKDPCLSGLLTKVRTVPDSASF